MFKAKAIVLATGGAGRAWKYTSNSWECTGDGVALALDAGADLIDMECVQFHPTGMVWPASVRGTLVTEGVRGDGGTLRNADGARFMFNYIPEYFKGETADNEKEADAWYEDRRNNRRTPDLLPRDEVAIAINAEIKAGRGSPHGGVFLDIFSRRPPEFIRSRLPSMYHQFRELAGVDITEEPMEVGPTCHYIMGGIRVDADTAATRVAGLFAAGEVAGGMHGSNRLGGNSLSDLAVFGRRAGAAAAEYATRVAGPLATDRDQIDAAARELLSPFENAGNESPFAIHADLQECMQALVGIIRTEGELRKALEEIAVFKQRRERVGVGGGREDNGGWHMISDLYSMLTVAEATTLSAIERKESRGCHTRADYPFTDDTYGSINVVVRKEHGELAVAREPLPEMPDELRKLVQTRT